MTTQDQIDARLAEFAVVYEEIGKLLKELALLQQAELAQAEYIQQTSHLDEEIRFLTGKHKELDGSQQKAQKTEAGLRPFRTTLKVAASDQNRFQSKETTDSTIRKQQPLQSARTDLKKLVGRWGRFWKLTVETQGRINRIADDPARPIGEALALLEWTTFENKIGTTEDHEAHLARLISWGTALVEYRERLVGEIDMLKTKYRYVIPILEIWFRRNTDGGREAWEKQISETNAAKEKEVEGLKLKIARLTL